ncbi:hypothetical protein N7461_007860 [Penicillium sp. DV-2018c]|nr:hypothetical protein N7461_007860 [Penicillium sp. DV-2018c]
MAKNPYFNTVVNPSTFKKRFLAEEMKLFSELTDGRASDWRREHLFACRVIRTNTMPYVLPILSEHLPSSLHLESYPEIGKFLSGPDGYLDQSEHRLGAVKSSYLNTSQEDMAMNPRHHRSSPRAGTKRILPPEFTDSSKIQAESSGGSASGSHASSSPEYMDPKSSSLQVSLEDNTVRLASSVIRHILYFAPPQDDTNLRGVLEFRDEKVRSSVVTPKLTRRIVAIDDGGLCFREEILGISRVMESPAVILEAKRQFECLEQGRPIISDNCLAQMTREVLAARLANCPVRRSQHRDGTVLVINAVQHYMCFLEFHVSDEYIADFESETPSQFLRVTVTRWLDLNTKTGRENVVKNLCGIMQRAQAVFQSVES